MFSDIFSQQKVLIPFVMCGVPSLLETQTIVESLVRGGARIIELGVPFSDPSADGVVLQQASEIALKNQVTLESVLETAQAIKARHPHIAIVLFTYLNPLLAFGLERYVKAAVKSGINATLTVDLPIEEAQTYCELHQAAGLKTVFLASPTTTNERLRKIQEASTGFLYYVSRTGVTGEQKSLSQTLAQEVAAIRPFVKVPMAIGFGISSPVQAGEAAQLGDGVVIGSAFMRMIMGQPDSMKRISEIETLTRDCLAQM